MKDPSLVAIYEHPKLGRVLIFDPTDEMTPFGQLRGDLQANYGLLVTLDGGDLIELPLPPPSASGVHRAGKFQLAPNGGLVGESRKSTWATALRGSDTSSDRFRKTRTA